jgi:hypothetical protein
MAESKIKYTVKIPLEKKSEEEIQEYKEVHFKTSEQCMEFLSIPKSTFYNILSGRLSMTHSSKMHLKDIIIIKHEIEKKKKLTKEELEKKAKDFKKDLLEKIV